MNVEKIEKLEEIVPLGADETIIDHKISRLTTAGENYGSLMLSVDITVQSPEGTEEIKAVAKMVPPNEFIQKIFNTQVSFKNEIGFYSNVVPVLQDFQKEQGMERLVEFFPKYYGSRINLTGDPDVVDSDAVLLLENLKTSGFTNLDRTVGFDFESSKLVISDLAHLHAVPLALKLQKPDVFETEVKKYLRPLKNAVPEDFLTQIFSKLNSVDEVRIYKNRVLKAFKELTLEKNDDGREPFATISHNDCWVNNTMVKMERGRAIDNKLVDFQGCSYASPARDLLFFLFTSVQNHVLQKHLDTLIRYYHETFVSVLRELKCDTTRFSFVPFRKELDIEARESEFAHIVFMTFIIFAPKGTVKELSEITPGDILQIVDSVTGAHREKLIFVVREFAKRNWI